MTRRAFLQTVLLASLTAPVVRRLASDRTFTMTSATSLVVWTVPPSHRLVYDPLWRVFTLYAS